METTMTAITGKEDQGDLSTPYQALIQFYYAFNEGDLGGIKRGWDEIRTVYENIFNGPAEVYVEYYDYSIHESPDSFYAVGRERGYFRLGEVEIKLAVRTSRIYKRVDNGWKQVHHHGSIEDPQLLEQYQSAVLGKR
jgi:ketosteroid isomerase-like protein